MYLPTPNPIHSDHLLLTKQQQQQQRQQRQRQTITMKRKKKSVCFFGVVFVKPYEKASSQEAVDIWYTDDEMATFKKEGRDMTVSYRNLTTSTTNNNTNTNKKDKDKDNKDWSLYRGFEYSSIRRQKHKIVSNRCVLYAQRQGMTARHIASVYRKANGWFTDVAFLQAVHDCLEIYDGNSTVNKNKGPQQEMMTLPSVAAMIPPRLFPFAMKSALALRKTTGKRTTTTTSIVTSVDDQQRRKRQRRALFLLK